MLQQVNLSPLLDALALQPGEFLSFSAKIGDGFGGFKSAQFSEQEAAEEWVSEQARRGASVWVTPNPTREGAARARDEDVTSKRWQLVDFDPVKTADDPNGLDAGKRTMCAEQAKKLWTYFDLCGLLVNSGRGHQVWLRVAEDIDRRRLRQWVQSEYSVPGLVDVDPLGEDPSRLCRCPGVANPRTGDLAEILDTGRASYLTAGAVEAASADWVAPADFDFGDSFSDAEPSEAELALVVGRAKELWDDSKALDGDRSMRLFAFCSELFKAGVEHEVACRLCWALPEGKARQDSRNWRYWSSLRDSVAKHMATQAVEEAAAAEQAAEDADLLANLAQECLDANSCMPAYAKDALEAAARVKQAEPGRFADCRRLLKLTKLLQPLSDWDSEVRKAAKALRSAEPVEPPDNLIRWLGNDRGDFLHWLSMGSGKAQKLPRDQVNTVLRAAVGAEMADVTLAAAINAPWVVTNRPFEARELPGRLWNVSLAQWRVEPVPGTHPMWDQLLRVVGRGLDEAVLEDEWCQRCGITTGGDYLLFWLACMAQHPFDRVAWLFLYSAAEGTGKSMLVESVRQHLLKGGVAKINRFLSSDRAFSAELDGMVLCYVEEENVAQHRQRMHDRAKDLVTGEDIDIERKGKDVYQVKNTTHIVQTANDPSYMVLKAGDTRVTAWEMLPFRPEEVISKAAMHEALAREAPAFLASLLSLAVPVGGDGRLRVPALKTRLKTSQAEAALGPMELFARQRPHWVGMSDDRLCERFLASLDESEPRRFWPRRRVLSSLDKLPRDLRDLRAFAVRLLEVPCGSYTPSDLAKAVGWPGDVRIFGQQIKALSKHCRVEVRKTNGTRRVEVQHKSGELPPAQGQGGSM